MEQSFSSNAQDFLMTFTALRPHNSSLNDRENDIVLRFNNERTPGFKLFLTIVVGLVLTIPLFSVWLLVYDRQTQSEEAARSITAGWGGPQAMSGPVLVIPYRATATETVVENGQSVTRSRDVKRELTLAPEAVELN